MASSTIDVVASFRVPAQMAVPALCRGALTGWPPLLEALRSLESMGVQPPFASMQPMGSASQLAQALATEPSILARDTPPQDLYSGFVWIALRLYRTARTVQLTLERLPALATPATNRRPADNGALVARAMTRPGGLVEQSHALAQCAGAFADRLQAMGGDIDAAKEELEKAGAALSSRPPVEALGMWSAIRAHGKAVQTQGEVHHVLAGHRVAAARVTVLAVIANLRLAAGSTGAAWAAAAAQFEAVSRCPAADLGNAKVLDEPLGLSVAIREWTALACAVQDFSRQVLVRSVES